MYRTILINANSTFRISCLLIAFMHAGCLFGSTSGEVKTDTLRWFDSVRQRAVPVAIYTTTTADSVRHQPLVIISHGYNENRSGSYLGYSFLANFLASKGFYVVSIQHELPTDSLLPQSGIPQIVRRPFWDRGADNMLFVINELKKQQAGLDFKHIALIGHSMGGDMTALFPLKYPGTVDKIITLDNRRMALPKDKKVKVLSLRSSDMAADEGVLPGEEEAAQFDIRIIRLTNITHNEMCDNANDAQRKIMIDAIFSFLKEE